MNLNSIDMSRIISYIKSILNTEYLSELTMNSFKYFSNLVGIVIRYPKEIFLKRLQKRKRRSLTGCIRRMNDCESKCLCRSCKRTIKKNRVVESDFFANLAYEHRLSKANEPPKAKDARIRNPCCVKEEDHRNAAIHRDVRITVATGWSWWNNFTCQRNLPPIYPPCEMATKSECSSYTSGFRSTNPDVESSKESVQLLRNASEASNISNNRSVVEIAVIRRKVHSRSKSDPQVVLRRQKINKIKKLIRSASTKATTLKKKKRNRRLFNVRRRRNRQKRERKVVKRPSFNNLSTMVCCSEAGPIVKK